MKGVLTALLVLWCFVVDGAEAAPRRDFNLVCRSAAKGCVSCELVASRPSYAPQLQSLLHYPNRWSLVAGRQRALQRNQAVFPVCEIRRPIASVRLVVLQGRRSRSFSTIARILQKDPPLSIPTPTATPVPTFGPIPPSPTPPSSAGVISLGNFRYEGTALLPRTAVGWSTGFEVGLLAIRRVGAEIHLFNDSHIYSTGALFEARLPSFAAAAPFPEVESITEWPDIFQGRRLQANDQPYPSGPPVNGLLWDPVRNGLWWAYGEPYNTNNRDAPSVGFTRFLPGDNLQANTPLRLHEPSQANHWTRGCLVLIPQRYAESLGGRRLGSGCGGYYSIIAGGSWGPALTAFDPDRPEDRVVLLGYPVSNDQRAPRPGDYFLADTAGSGSGWMGRNPAGSDGTWTGADEIGGESGAGAALFVDLPSARGVLFWASHGTGRIGYDAGSITASGRKNRLYIYDPEKLLAVYRGLSDRALIPDAIADWPSPAGFQEGRIGGVAQDPDDPAVFYVVQTGAYHMGVEDYPVIHRYRIVH